MDEEFSEKRASTRLKGRFKIQIQEGAEQQMVKTIDLSSRGLHFKSPKAFPLFREVSLSLSLPLLPPKTAKGGAVTAKGKKEQSLVCSAIVVRSERSALGGGYSVALSFVGMDDKHRKKIEQFIAQASRSR